MVKNPPANAGDSSSIPGLGRSPGVGNGNPLQYSCLENYMDRGAWQATVHGVTKRVGHDLATNNHHHHKRMMSQKRRQNSTEKNEKKFNKMWGYLILHNI